MNYLPNYRSNKEYESNLSEARIQAGLTVKELCEKLNIHQSVYSGLNSGIISPIMRSGAVRPSAQKLAEFFDMSLADLWPRYFCDRQHYVEFPTYQIVECFHQGMLSSEFKDPELLLLQKEKYLLVNTLLSKLRNNYRKVIIMRWFRDMTLEEIAKQLKYTRERIRQIENKALMMLKRTALNIPESRSVAMTDWI